MQENNTPDNPQMVNDPPQTPIPVIRNEETEPSSKKFVFMLVIGVILIATLVGGIYLYLSRQQTGSEVNQTNPPVNQPTPEPVVQENLENDLNAIDVASPDADFTSVDSDLKQL